MARVSVSPLHTPSAWRNFPRIMIAVMLAVMAVNVRFIVLAATTFPGAATSDDFDTSNRYNQILAAIARQKTLGWREDATTQGNVAILKLSLPDGAPLRSAKPTASAVRPLGNTMPIDLTYHEAQPGLYIADQKLPIPGQWQLNLHVRHDAETANVTRRIMVR